MADNKVIMITGAGGYWGGRLSARLLSEPGCHIIGVDNVPPFNASNELDFIDAELDNPLVAELLQREKVNVVCHLKSGDGIRNERADGQNNGANTGILLAACARAGVENVLLRSSTSVYGAHSDNSAFLSEESPLRGSRRHRYLRDLLEIEQLCLDNKERFQEIDLTIYRFANIVGRSVKSPMTRYLAQTRPQVLLGYDPITQFIHEDDVIELLALGALNPTPGIYNVAADGSMPLTRVMRLLRKKPIPMFHRFVYKKSRFRKNLMRKKGRSQPLDWDYLRYPWVADLTRMREILEFYPERTAQEALQDFSGGEKTVAPEAAGASN